MPLDANRLALSIIAARNAMPKAQSSDGSTATSQGDAMIHILAREIVKEIKQATVTTTSGAPDGEHTGNIT